MREIFAIPLVAYIWRKLLIWKDKCTPMFIAALFMIANTWKQPKCPWRDEWIMVKADVAYIYIFFFRFFSFIGCCKILSIVPCTIRACCLPILYIVVCIYFYGLPWWLSGKESTWQCRRCRWKICTEEDPLEKGMSTHSSIITCRSLWAEEPGRLQTMRLQRSDTTEYMYTYTYFPESSTSWLLP